MTLWITITTRTAITRIPGNQLQRGFNSDATRLVVRILCSYSSHGREHAFVGNACASRACDDALVIADFSS
jgi:hypothetical protein